MFFRYHEKELVRRAKRSIPGPLLGAAARKRDVADAGQANVGGLDDTACRGSVVAEDAGDSQSIGSSTWLASIRVLETSVPRRRDLMPRAGRAQSCSMTFSKES
jgi:hypothetical protein